jgi:hypothetical protein
VEEWKKGNTERDNGEAIVNFQGLPVLLTSKLLKFC